MKIVTLASLFLIAGCTVIPEKRQDYEEVISLFSRPDKVRVCFIRENEDRRGFEARCFGEGCTLPECP